MKRVLFVLVLFLSVSFAAFAQHGSNIKFHGDLVDEKGLVISEVSFNVDVKSSYNHADIMDVPAVDVANSYYVVASATVEYPNKPASCVLTNELPCNMSNDFVCPKGINCKCPVDAESAYEFLQDNKGRLYCDDDTRLNLAYSEPRVEAWQSSSLKFIYRGRRL